jgi:hypothetical protein
MSKSFPPVSTDVHAAPDAPRYSILSILEQHASRQPGMPAIVREDLTLTYAELFERVRACATLLVHHGLRPGEITGISLAHEIGLKVVGEGVETASQHRFLVTNGCDELQGYRFSRPLDEKQIVALLERGVIDPDEVAETA